MKNHCSQLNDGFLCCVLQTATMIKIEKYKGYEDKEVYFARERDAYSVV